MAKDGELQRGGGTTSSFACCALLCLCFELLLNSCFQLLRQRCAEMVRVDVEQQAAGDNVCTHVSACVDSMPHTVVLIVIVVDHVTL